jgi:hypothetical protein
MVLKIFRNRHKLASDGTPHLISMKRAINRWKLWDIVRYMLQHCIQASRKLKVFCVTLSIIMKTLSVAKFFFFFPPVMNRFL